MAFEDKVVITCALTGVLANRKHCPAIPYTPVEIAEEARRAYEAGASVVHLHARNDDGSPTFAPSVSEYTEVPGNAVISESDMARRVAAIHALGRSADARAALSDSAWRPSANRA